MSGPYDVVINISMAGNASAGLGALSREMATLDSNVKKATKSFDAFKVMILGTFAKKIGEDVFGGMGKVLDAAANFQHVQSQMVAMGMKEKEVAESVANSRKLAGQYTHATRQEILEMNRHGIEIFGSADAAQEHMPLMAKLADLQHRWQAGHTGVKGPDVVTSIRDMMKTAEGGILWGKDPKDFDRFSENLMRSLWATGANVSASQYVQGARASKGAFPGWGDSFKFGVFPAMLQEWQGAGVGAATAAGKLSSGVGWKKAGIIEGQRLGIVDRHVDARHPFTMQPGDIKGNALYRSDPKQWFDEFLKPALDKIYGPVSQANMNAREAAIRRMLYDRNAAEFIDRFDREGAKYDKDRVLRDKAMLDMPEDLSSALVAFQAKWQDLMVALGSPSLGSATELMGNLTRGVMSLTGVFEDHPDLAACRT